MFTPVIENLYASKHVKRKRASCKSAAATGQVRRLVGLKGEAVVLTQGTSATRGNALFLLKDKRAVDLLIRFFTLLALLRACEQLVNDRGSQGV